MDRTSWLVWLSCSIFAGSLGGLLFLAWGPASAQVSLYGLGTVGPLLAVITTAVVWLTPVKAGRRLSNAALLLPCALTPVAALGPWTVAPSHLGVAPAHFPFFVSWLSRYPNFGPINLEVLLGTGAMLGACAMPTFFTWYSLSSASSEQKRWLIFALHLVAYVPVLFELDFSLVIFALATLQSDAANILFLSAPLQRMVSTIAMFVLALRRRTQA
jgi:hypothetical protein